MKNTKTKAAKGGEGAEAKAVKGAGASRKAPRAAAPAAPDPLAGISDATYEAPFSPVIMKARMPDALVAKIVDVAAAIFPDAVLTDRHMERSPVLRNVSQRVEVLQGLAGGPVVAWLEAAGVAYAKRVAGAVGRVKTDRTRAFVGAAWVNRQVQNDFVPLHLHDGSLSGVAYLKVPDQMHLEEDEAGRIQFFDGRPIDPNFVRYRYSIMPVPGDVYIFPSWLQHVVYPFRRRGERWAMSFNLDLGEPPPEPGDAPIFQEGGGGMMG